jgi:aldose 1-epimerase
MSDAPVTFLPLGAIIQTLNVGGVNIVQGFPDQSLYESHNGPFFGETIGRIANRVKNAQIDSLNGGKTYRLAKNNGPNSLHGGVVGWGKRVWDGPETVAARQVPGVDGLRDAESIKFSLLSEDGDEGYPGAVQASAVYTVGKQDQDGKEVTVLDLDYEAELVGGADETVINMTNHSYVYFLLTLLIPQTSCLRAIPLTSTVATSTSPAAPPSKAPS